MDRLNTSVSKLLLQSRVVTAHSGCIASRLQEDAARFGGQKKVVRRGDKDNHFVGYTYKRKPTVNTRPSVASSAAAAAAATTAASPATSGSWAGAAGGVEAGQGAGGGAAAVGAVDTDSGKKTPTSGKTSPSSEKSSSSPSGTGGGATRKAGGKKSGFGLFGGRKAT